MPASTQLALAGLHCASCVQRVKTALMAVPGVSAATVNLADRSAMVQGEASPEALLQAVRTTGFQAWVVDDERDALLVQERAGRREYRGKLWRTALGLSYGTWLMLHMHHLARLSALIAAERHELLTLAALTAAVMLASGWHFFAGAWAALRQRSASMDTLISLGTLAAWGYSAVVVTWPRSLPTEARHVYFEAAVMIIALVNLGSLLESSARRKAQGAIRELVALQPDTATLRDGDGERSVAITQLRPGDRLLLRAGERIAVDAEVAEGEVRVDESMLTGEYQPVLKAVATQLHAGSLVLSGSAEIIVTHIGSETSLAEIIRRVREAQNARPPIANRVDRVAAAFVPAILFIAALTFGLWLLLGPSPHLAHALIATVSVLIIACPCVLGLAVPMSIMMASGLAARHGILIRDGAALQMASRMSCIIFDKTGTLTQGRGSLTHIEAHAEYDDKTLLRWAAAAEFASEHVFARAILAHFASTDLLRPSAENFQSIAGGGIQARVEGHDIVLGNAALLRAQGVSLPDLDASLLTWGSAGVSPILMSVDARFVGLFGISDTLRPEARIALGRLRQIGLRTCLLSGDSRENTAALAQSLGIETFWGGQSPADKLALLHQEQVRGEIVGMVGDGINDAPALAAADVGFAIGQGTDVAMAASGITLTGSDLNKIFIAIRLSRATLRNIHQNLWAAFIYNLIAVPVAAGALYPWTHWQLNPMLAAAAMAASSLTVVLNASRLRWLKLD